MRAVTIEEAQAHLPELIAEAERGGEVVIRTGERSSVRLEPVPTNGAAQRSKPLSQVDFRAIRKRIWGKSGRFFSADQIQEMKDAEDGLVP